MTDKAYFEWLRKQVDFIDFEERYDLLFEKLHSIDYCPVLPMDQNRAGDGLIMRIRICGDYIPTSLGGRTCTFLEFLVALTHRLHYICDGIYEYRVKELFWRLLANLRLNYLDNRHWDENAEKLVEDVVERVCTNTDSENGEGGLFPMAAPKQNQRNLEVWYQMNQYLMDPNGRDLLYSSDN